MWRMPCGRGGGGCSAMSALVEATHEMCGAAGCRAGRVSGTGSRVPSRVVPPAPYVQEKNRGLSLASSCQAARSFSFPSGVFGGKNSKLYALSATQVGFERRVDRAVDWRVEPGFVAHAHDRTAEPGCLERLGCLRGR